MGLSNILFILLLAGGIIFFTINLRKIIRNINLGKNISRNDNKRLRWKTMTKVALGQSKMVTRPLAGIMHIFVYVGFVIINIEVLEIIIDGIFGTHRILSFLGFFYNFLIGSFEILAVLVLLGCIVFFIRRNIGRIKRFWSAEMTIGPRSDANAILITEILLMSAFLTMNTCDFLLQQSGVDAKAGAFPISSNVAILFSGMNLHSLQIVQQSCWWFHIIGIIAFLNYLPYSKHFHILLAFPNVFYSNLQPKGEFTNLEAVTNEVKLMFDPTAATAAPPAVPERFGAKDVTDLTWKQLMDAYSCTECGRCTSSCPANETGKILSPRKIMMDTRRRLVEVGNNLDKNGAIKEDGKSLLGDYITPEELWACTSCNACVQECPVDIDPLSIIVEMRRFLVMEQSAAPTGLNLMFTNVENNGAPWQFPPTDRFNWASEK